MSGWTAIVPIKPAAERKSRLEPRLTFAARLALTETMLAHVLDTLAQSAVIAGIRILARERPSGWDGGWSRDGGAGLNEELEAAADTIGQRLVVLHADLPALTAADIDTLVSAAAGGSAIAPDRHARGTNAIALESGGAMRFAFGADSFRRHRMALPEARIVIRPGLALDIDDEDDLAEAVRLGLFGPLERERR